MTLLRDVTLVAGLLLGVAYTVASYVETRRPLNAAPQVVEQDSLDHDAADSSQRLPLDYRSISTGESASQYQFRVRMQA
jgi:hypothetical protein